MTTTDTEEEEMDQLCEQVAEVHDDNGNNEIRSKIMEQYGWKRERCKYFR